MTWVLREHDTAVCKVNNLYLQDFHFKQALPNTRKSWSEVRRLKSKHEEWRHGIRGIEKQIEDKLMIEEKHKDNNRYEIKVGWYFEEKKGRELKKWVINTNHQKQIGSYKVKTRKLPRGKICFHRNNGGASTFLLFIENHNTQFHLFIGWYFQSIFFESADWRYKVSPDLI